MVVSRDDDSKILGPGWIEVASGLWERTNADGRKSHIRRLTDGTFQVSVQHDEGVFAALSNMPNADVREVRSGKRAKYFAWMPHTEPEIERRHARIESLVGPIKEHIAAGRLAGVVADDVTALMAGFAEILAESIESGRSEVVRAAKGVDLEHSDLRRRGPEARLVKNKLIAAKAAAKVGALELWKERNAGEHPKLRTVEQFATEVMRRWPVLTSAKVICGWSARWTKEVKDGKNPVC